MPVRGANPLIALQGSNVVPSFSNILSNVEKIESMERAREQAPAQKELLEAQAQQAQAGVPSDISQFTQRQREFTASTAAGARDIIPDLESGNIGIAIEKLTERADRLDAAQAAGQDVDSVNTRKAIELAKTDPQELLRASQNVVALDERVNQRKKGQASAKTEILESGATIQALPSGEVVVKDPLGNTVSGEARTNVIKEAQQAQVKAQQERADITVSTARRVEQVKKATATADKAFNMVDKLRQNITNLEGVTPLIGEGADTGPISKFFPSFRESTVKLEQLQKRLGLDVVGATTFGALSKGELDLAKAVALPLALKGDALIEWTNDAIAAKKKLANYFEEQAIFLGDGNTQADWLKFKKAELKDILGDASETDIRKTMRDNDMTRSEVIAELKRRKTSGR